MNAESLAKKDKETHHEAFEFASALPREANQILQKNNNVSARLRSYLPDLAKKIFGKEDDFEEE